MCQNCHAPSILHGANDDDVSFHRHCPTQFMHLPVLLGLVALQVLLVRMSVAVLW